MRNAVFGTLVLLVAACSPDAVENQDADGAGPVGEAVYGGVLFRRGNIVVSDLERAYTIRAALPGLGLSMLREKTLVTVDQEVGIETGFHDWDGNLIVLYELEDAPTP